MSNLYQHPNGLYTPYAGAEEEYQYIQDGQDLELESQEVEGSNYNGENYEEGEEGEVYSEPIEGEFFEWRNSFENSITVGDPITTISFDPFEEILWTGTASGRVVSYVHDSMERYTSIMCHPSEIRDLLCDENGFLSISQNAMKYTSRGGVHFLNMSNEQMIDLQCLSSLSSTPRIETVVVGGAKHLFVFDIVHSRILKEHPMPFGTSSLHVTNSGYLMCGHTNGLVTLRDLRTFNTEQTIQSHTGGINDIDVQGNIFVTCGWSKRLDAMFVDPFVKMYDIRTMRCLASFPFGDPFLCKFHPAQDGSLLITSQNGRFVLYDCNNFENPTNHKYYQVLSQNILCVDISSSGDIIAFGDMDGSTSEWANKDDVQVNESSRPTEMVEYQIPRPPIQMDENSPLSRISLPLTLYDDQSLFSNWNPRATFPVPRPPMYIDTALFPDFKQVDFVGYASNPGLQRNMTASYEYSDSPHFGRKKLATKLEKILQQKKQKVETRPPKSYRHIGIKHTKLGIDGFDFKFYNKTPFGGLENTLPNSYCNSGLQVLHFIPQVRVHMLNHLCKKEFCLSCELGFLFYMLDHSEEMNCQASNFLRSFRQIPQATGLGLTETPADDQISLVRLMENFNRFIFEQLHKESSQNPPMFPSEIFTSFPPIIDQVFGTTGISHNKCLSCKFETRRETSSFQFDLVLPEQTPTNPSGSEATFLSVLHNTLKRETHTKAWCEKCARYQLTEQRREITNLPNILVINTAASKADMEFWKSRHQLDEHGEPIPETQSWLPLEFNLKIDDVKEKVHYQLTALISHSYDASKKASRHSHLISQIKIHPSYHALHKQEQQEYMFYDWYIFNDFHIIPCKESEVLDFTYKSPCVLYYTRVDIDSRVPILPVLNPITENVFFVENPIRTRSTPTLSFVPPTRNNLPKIGNMIAIDAEFVSLGAEETELRSDGSKIIINPCHFSLARVSLLRDTGEPFMDDYIVTFERIVDYLTRYSGISLGDLDPKVSKHYLITLKATYLKLRYLIDQGCTFVGHGLATDFRIINILVPPENVIDTVELFHLPGQRKISLRFLASCLLNLDIQQETHSSIEDAVTALKLYHKYLELKKEDKFNEALQKIYELGRQTKWGEVK